MLKKQEKMSTGHSATVYNNYYMLIFTIVSALTIL